MPATFCSSVVGFGDAFLRIYHKALVFDTQHVDIANHKQPDYEFNSPLLLTLRLRALAAKSCQFLLEARLFAAKDETAPVRIAAGVVSVQRDGCAVA